MAELQHLPISTILKNEMHSRRWSDNTLREMLCLDSAQYESLMCDTLHISAALALKLEQVTMLSAEYYLRIDFHRKLKHAAFLREMVHEKMSYV